MLISCKQKQSYKRRELRVDSHIEGHEGVKWELGFACFWAGKMGFTALGLGFNYWETVSKMGEGFLVLMLSDPSF